MDTTINYQTLAMNIVMAAMEDAQGCGPDAELARQWLGGNNLNDIPTRVDTLTSTLEDLMSTTPDPWGN